MKLILTNGYPFPYPTHLSEDEQEAINARCQGVSLEIIGVTHFEMKHTVTVEFDSQVTADIARAQTKWRTWGCEARILEATTSAPDGYAHPAIVVGDTAYCGFMLKEHPDWEA